MGHAVRGVRGYTLLEIIIALGLGTLVVGLVGALFLFSFRSWQRAADLRAVQIEATTAADLIARDIAGSSRTGLTLNPPLPVEAGRPLLAIPVPAEGGAVAEWAVYALDEGRGELHRFLVRAGESSGIVDRRLVTADVRRVDLTRTDGVVTIEVEALRRGASFVARRTATPHNP